MESMCPSIIRVRPPLGADDPDGVAAGVDLHRVKAGRLHGGGGERHRRALGARHARGAGQRHRQVDQRGIVDGEHLGHDDLSISRRLHPAHPGREEPPGRLRRLPARLVDDHAGDDGGDHDTGQDTAEERRAPVAAVERLGRHGPCRAHVDEGQIGVVSRRDRTLACQSAQRRGRAAEPHDVSSDRRPRDTRESRTESVVSTPGTPAKGLGPSLSAGGQGEWSDATLSIVPSATSATMRRRSASPRTGGQQAASDPIRLTSSWLSAR